MATPFATSYMIDKKLDPLVLGSSKEEVTRQLGSPIFLVELAHEDSTIEILGYDLGNYWYNESRLFLFKNDVLVGRPDNSFELMKLLSQMRVMGPARFFDSKQ
jgi:hypothetical protein